jgi:nitrite reductase/ring-hydroxylating ferredoxin subunit
MLRTSDLVRSRENLYVDTYPQSWYAVVPSTSLDRKQIRPFEAFGQQWVLFRTESDEVQVSSRFCPHMGASFHTGHVRGDRIVCPFHHWEYEQGKCVRIPYMEGGKIPIAAQVPTLPVVEHLGWIWVWNGTEPTFQLPDLPEASDSDFGMQFNSQWFDIHPLLILENGCDAQHFKYIHKINFARYDVDITRDEPHHFAFRVNQEVRGPFGKTFKLVTGIHYVGGSTIFGTLENDGKLTARFIAAPLPVAFRRTQFHLIVYARRLSGAMRLVDPFYQRWFAHNIFTGSTDDYLPIWRHINTEHRGALVAEDRLQQRFRKYYRAHLPEQFARSAHPDQQEEAELH